MEPINTYRYIYVQKCLKYQITVHVNYKVSDISEKLLKTA